MHLKRFKNQNSALRASQAPTRMEICTFIDLAEFIRQMAENIHTFGGSPIFSYGHPASSQRGGRPDAEPNLRPAGY